MKEKLDPTNQKDWEKFGKRFESDVDDILKDVREEKDRFGSIKIEDSSSDGVVSVGDNSSQEKTQSQIERDAILRAKDAKASEAVNSVIKKEFAGKAESTLRSPSEEFGNQFDTIQAGIKKAEKELDVLLKGKDYANRDPQILAGLKKKVLEQVGDDLTYDRTPKDLDVLLREADGKKTESASKIIERNKRIRRKENLPIEELELRAYLEDLMKDAKFKDITTSEDIVNAVKILRNETLKKIKDKGKINGSEKEEAVAMIIGLAEKKAKNKGKEKSGFVAAMKAIAIHLSEEEEVKKTAAAEKEVSTKQVAKELDDKEVAAKKEAEPVNVAKKEAEEDRKNSAKKMAEEEARQVAKTAKELAEKTKSNQEEVAPVANKKDSVEQAKKLDEINKDIKDLEKSIRARESRISKMSDGDGKDTISEIQSSEEKILKTLESERNALAEKIRKEKAEAKAEEKGEFTLEQVYEKLTASGATDEDIKYFFNLPKKERLDILNKNQEDLRVRVGELAKERMVDYRKNDKLNRVPTVEKYNDDVLKHFSRELEMRRKEYLEKEDDIKIKVSRLKNFFKNFVSIDKNYEVEKELVEYKEEYEKMLKIYLEAIVEIEKPADAEEREIIYRHAQFGETLKLMDAKVIMKLEKNPKFEKTKNFFKVGASTFIDKYKTLLGKPKDLIMKETDSKILGFGGGMIAVGGAVAFAANYAPGLRYLTVPLSVAVATKGYYSRAESEAVVEKEKSLEEGVEKLESRLEYINDLGVKVDEAFKKELGLAAQNIPEEAMKEREKVGRRMAWSLVKAIAVSSLFYAAGTAIRGYFSTEDLPKMDDLTKAETTPAEKLPVITSTHGGKMHFQGVVPISQITPLPLAEQGSIDDIMARAGITTDAQPEEQMPSAFETPRDGSGVDASKIPDVQTEKQIPSAFDGMETEGETPVDMTAAEKSAEDIFSAEMPDRESFVGIELDDNGIGKLKVIEGTGIKDTLAKMLLDNSEKFTQGEMSSDIGRYASVEEWADKRAIGIVGELKEQYPNYNFDKVSTETTIFVDLSDKADIKIVGMEDDYNLGGERAEIAKLEEVVLRSNVLETAERMTNNEMRLAYATGVSSEEYAKINHLTVAEFLGSNNQSTQELRDIVAAINATEDDPTNTVAETLRGINDEDMTKLLESRDLSDFNYDDYLKRIVREELLAQSDILNALNDIKDKQISVDNPVFKEFRKAAENTLGEGFTEFSKNQTVREFLIETVKRTYEMGKIDAFRTALSHIKL